MDAFYASVEEHDDPRLAGKPLIVGWDGGRGVVAAASYAVRRYGVHSAMPRRTALAVCRQAICVRPRMQRYQAVRRIVFGAFPEISPLVEGLSLDEAFLDVTASQELLGSAVDIARLIKRRICELTGLTASVGVAPNKLVAKIASDLMKPDGLTHVTPERVREVLDPLSVRRLPGLGRKTGARVEAAGIETLGELRSAPDALLWPLFGRYSAWVRERASGIDDRPVLPEVEEKSLSAEDTFEEDIGDSRTLHVQGARIADVLLEGVLCTQRFFLDFRQYRPIIDPGGALAHPGGVAPEERPQERIGRAAELAERLDAGRLDPRAGLAPEAREAPHREGIQHLAHALGGDMGEPVGLHEVGGDLGHELIRGDPHRGGEPGELADAPLDEPRDVDGAAEQLLTRGDIEKRLIERQPLDEGRHLAEHAEDDPRDLLVALHARPHADRLRAEPQRRAHGHRRVHAVPAHGVARGRHHAAAAVPADDERLAGQPRVVVLLDGRVERIHVDVQDRARHGVSPLFAVVRARAARAAKLTG